MGFSQKSSGCARAGRAETKAHGDRVFAHRERDTDVCGEHGRWSDRWRCRPSAPGPAAAPPSEPPRRGARPDALAKSRQPRGPAPRPEVSAVVQLLLNASQKRQRGCRCFNWGGHPRRRLLGSPLCGSCVAVTIESTLSNLHFYEITGKSMGPGREDEVRGRGGASCRGAGLQRPPWETALPRCPGLPTSSPWRAGHWSPDH